MQIGLAIVGVLMLIWAAVGKTFRWGLHDFIEDESDIALDRRTGDLRGPHWDCVDYRGDPLQRAGVNRTVILVSE